MNGVDENARLRIVILEDDSRRARRMLELLSAHIPGCDVTVVDVASDFCECISDATEQLHLVSLDHDLNSPRDTNIDPGDGMLAAECLACSPHRTSVIVHTSNLPAGARMMHSLTQHGFPLIRVVPYDDLLWIEESWLDAVKGLLVGRKNSLRGDTPLTISLNTEAQALIDQALREGEVLLLGVIGIDRSIYLFRGGPAIDASRRLFRGHQDILDSGVISAGCDGGFCVCLKGGKLAVFYRQSVLNRHKPNFCLTNDQVDDILFVLGVPDVDPAFRIYPR